MATRTETIEDILAAAGDALDLHPRKMFGEYGLYLGGKMVAMACDDTLFVKDVPVAIERLGNPEMRPPYPGAKAHLVVSRDFMDQPSRLADLLRSLERALPAPKPKRSTKKSWPDLAD